MMSDPKEAFDYDGFDHRERRLSNADDDELHDLHGVETWTPQTSFDYLIADVYRTLASNRMYVVYLLLAVVLLTNFSISLAGLFVNPVVGAFTALSVVPALLVAFYVWESNPLKRANAIALSVTFVVGLVTVGFAYVVNNMAFDHFAALPVLGLTLFFLLVVAPVEEGLKMLAVYVYPAAGDYLDTAIDGAVFGAFAGLGFATGENALYIVTGGFLGPGGLLETVVGRAGVAPAHVLWAAISGYYIGLANLNREYAGPIVFKGFVIVVVFHAAYNIMVSHLPAASGAFTDPEPLSIELYTLSTLLVYYSIVWYSLEKLVTRYRRVTKEYDALL